MPANRVVPLAGVLMLLLIIVAFAITGETPSIGDDTAKILSFYADNDSESQISGALLALGAIAFVFFAGSVREVLRSGGASDGLLATSSIGAGAFAIGLTLFASISFALGDASGEVPPATMVTLNTLGEDLFFPLVLGVCVYGISTGVAGIRSGGLPKPLAWIALIIGIAAILGPVGFFAFLALVLWSAITGIVLSVRD